MNARAILLLAALVAPSLGVSACGGPGSAAGEPASEQGRFLPTGPSSALILPNDHASTPFVIDPNVTPEGLDPAWKQLVDGRGNPGPVWVRLVFVYPFPGSEIDPAPVVNGLGPPGRVFHYVAEACMDPVPNPQNSPHLAFAFIRGYWSLDGAAPINRVNDSAVQVIHELVPNGGCVMMRRLPPEWGGIHGQQWVFFDPPGARYLIFGARFGRDDFFAWNDSPCPTAAEVAETSARPACVMRSAHSLEYQWPGGAAEPTPAPSVVARDDAYTMARGAILTVPAPGVVANDSLPLNAVPIVRFVQPLQLPSAAGFTNLGSGGFRLELSGNPGFTGTVTFQYEVAVAGVASTATVRVGVN